jgi:methionyl-tRNA formyltransferase
VAGHFDVVTVVTQPDRPAGRNREPSISPIKRAAWEMNLPVWQPERVRAPESVQRIREVAPELVIVAAFGQILPQTILNIPPWGCLNVHGSLLPKLRGASPIAYAILEGYSETGITTMMMDAGMDTGPILSQGRTTITPEDTAVTLGARLSTMAADLLVETLALWLQGNLLPKAQDDDRATYTRIIAKDDGLVDWSNSAETIWRMIRAYDPWPGVYTLWNGRRLKILQALPASGYIGGAPGVVERASHPDSTVSVQTGDGLLVPLRLQLEGKKPMDVGEFLRGQPQLVGARLG